jgi:DNA-directed RNA polymerase subunit F
MIAMKLVPDPGNPNQNILELRVKAPAASEPTPIPVEKIPTLIYIDDSIEEDQLPMITHALTDTINRITWPEQIQLASSQHQLPNHLEVQNLHKEELFTHAASLGTCALIVLTNNETKELRKEIAKASEFLTKTQVIQPTSTIELIDNLNDHIKDLKEKILVNLEIEVELPDENDLLESLDYLTTLSKVKNKYFANLIDLASEDEKAYAFTTFASRCSVTYSFEDLVIGRRAAGGQQLTI